MSLRALLATLILLLSAALPATADVAPPRPGLLRIVLTVPGMR